LEKNTGLRLLNAALPGTQYGEMMVMVRMAGCEKKFHCAVNFSTPRRFAQSLK